MSNFGYVGLKDESGTVYGVKHINNKPRVSAMPYTYDIAEGKVANHAAWSKMGYTPTMTTAESDLWSAAGTINWMAAEAGLEVYCSDNTDDKGVVIFSGSSTSGSATELDDTAKDFTAGTPVAVGDLLLLDTGGEYGIITAVAATKLTCAAGFSGGGSGASQAYRVVDKSGGGAGAQVVQANYLDDAFAAHTEFIVTNGTTPVNTTATDFYRIQSFRVIFAGANAKPTGYIDLREQDASPVFTRISAGYTRARNIAYTVPAGYALYVTDINWSYGYAANQTHYCRLYTRATQNEGFRTPGIFYPYTECVLANSSAQIHLTCPTKLVAGVDLKVSGIASVAGIADVTLRGWLETV